MKLRSEDLLRTKGILACSARLVLPTGQCLPNTQSVATFSLRVPPSRRHLLPDSSARCIGWSLFLLFAIVLNGGVERSFGDDHERLDVWPNFAPGETSRDTGLSLPTRPGESKPIDRVSGVRRPTLDVYPAKNNPSGTGVLILPGGGFTYVVPDLEGSEAAAWLNDIGITAFVLRYRTKESAAPGEPLWQRPLQDTQRAVRLIRKEAERLQLRPGRIGILGFSAGGQVGAIAHSKGDRSTYDAVDDIDQQACRPDFALFIYPWQVLDAKTGELLEQIQVTDQSAPTFLVHTHDDASSAIGAAKIYIALKQKNIPAELHIYQNGGHGYGIRDRPNSVISTWPARATDWLKVRGLLDPAP